jgi:hypothetical protein
MGKGNIVVEPSQDETKASPDEAKAYADEVAATFHMGEKSLRIRLRPAYMEKMERELDGKPEKAVIDYAFRIMDTAPDEIFEVS